MYITCLKCHSHFVVQPKQIGPLGRKVRCSKCGHIWHQQLKDSVKLEPVITTHKPDYTNQFSPGINLPALLPIKIPQYLYTMPALFLCAIVILSMILFQDFYDLDSSEAAKLLSIRDIHVVSNKDAGKITIAYKVTNASNQTISMPLVRVRLFDKNSITLKSHVADQEDVVLLPKQSVSIKTEFSSVPDITDKVDITLGSKLAFILR